MKKRKVLYVISLVQKSLVFEWTAKALKNDFELSFILLNHSDSPLEDFLNDNGVKVRRIQFKDKRDYASAFFHTVLFIIRNRPDVVHTHLFDAQIIGLTVAWFLRIKKRIYTRHNSNYHHVYHKKGIRYDRWSNAMATHIISLSKSTYKTLTDLEGVPKAKIIKIPHGFDLKSFTHVPSDRIEQIKKRWKIFNSPVIGVISRHIEWKGIQYIIPAFKKFLELHSDACLVLANATGPYADKVKNLIVEIPIRNIILIPFEEDVAALYKCFDIYVHTPIDELCEAFGQTYVEALASGVPSIFTLSGIAEQFIEHNRNAYVVEFKNTDNIYDGMEKIWNDVGYRNQLIEGGIRSISPRFENESTITKLKQLYNTF